MDDDQFLVLSDSHPSRPCRYFLWLQGPCRNLRPINGCWSYLRPHDRYYGQGVIQVGASFALVMITRAI